MVTTTNAPLDVVAKQIRDWQRVTFPNFKNPKGAAYHLIEEAQEVARDIVWGKNAGEELADVFFLLIQVCTLTGVDLVAEAERKLAKNKQRTWQAPDSLGRIHHVA